MIASVSHVNKSLKVRQAETVPPNGIAAALLFGAPPPGYYRIPYGHYQKNWSRWERERYWDKDREWHGEWHGERQGEHEHGEHGHGHEGHGHGHD